MGRKNIMLYIAIVGLVTLVIIGSVIILNNDSEENKKIIPENESTENNSYIYPLSTANESEILTRQNIFFDEIPQNTQPQFKVGDKYEYLGYAYGLPENGQLPGGIQSISKITYSVTKKEKLNGTECYVIAYNITDNEPGNSISFGVKTRFQAIKSVYVDVKTGKPIKLSGTEEFFQDSGEIDKSHYERDIPASIAEVDNSIPAYSPWMLSLKDDFKLEITRNNFGKTIKEIISVIGREKIKNRECYKLEFRRIDEDNKVTERQILWVDAEKRIIVKEQTYLENLKIYDLELVSDLK